MQTTILVGFYVGFLFALQKVLQYWRAVRSIQNLPGSRTLLSHKGVIPNMIPRIPGIALGRDYVSLNKHKVFASIGWDAFSAVGVLPRTTVTLVLADAEAIKEVTTSRSRFPKPIWQYRVLMCFGHNIVTSEGDQWKKYRKICAPAFSDRNNKMVWDEAVRVVVDLFQNVWGEKDTITVDHCVDLTMPIALFIIGSAGFGRQVSWKDDTIVPTGHKLTFKAALHTVATDVFLKFVVPDWALFLTDRTRNLKLAFDELQQYMSEMIMQRQAVKFEERYDLFSNLLDANNQDTTEGELTQSELIGNIFIFLIAGHETTSHTLSFAFALLALHQEEQEILYQQIKSVIPDDGIPTYNQMAQLTQPMAVLYETLRMFPSVPAVPKYSAEDTTLVISNIRGEKKTIPVPMGTNIDLDISGLHYNPRYWEDPYAFKPSRFLGDWPRDAFAPFSVGARACLGRKFFETESTAILTMFVSRYNIGIKEEPQFIGETFEERKARVLAHKPGIAQTPIRVPLVFRRR